MVESGEETDRVLAGSRIGLCLDTGHLLIGGGDPVRVAVSTPDRIAHVHLKDVRLDLARQVQAGEATYTEAVAAGMYVPLGQGDVDIAAIVGALEAHGYAGWYVLEQDTILPGRRRARRGPGRADVRASLAHLLAVAGAAPGGGRLTRRPTPRDPRRPWATDARLRRRRDGPHRRGHLPARSTGSGWRTSSTFEKFLGGSATNVAVAAARHGLPDRPDHPHRRRPVRPLRAPGPARLRCRRPASSRAVDGPPTPVTFCEVFPPDDFPLYFYRYPIAPDLMIEADELPLDAIRDARIFWATVTGPVPGAQPHGPLRRLGGARPAHATPSSTSTTGRCSGRTPRRRARQVGAALDHVTVAVGNREECEVAVGETDPHRAADALLERGRRARRGEAGPQGRARRDPRRARRGAAVPGRGRQRPRRRRRLRGRPVPRPARAAGTCAGPCEFANVAGAIVASRLECSTAMPTERRGRGAASPREPRA